MPDLVDIYERSQKPRPVDAKQIPDQAVNFVDQTNTFHEGWNNFQQIRATRYTERSLTFYNEVRASMVVPESFVPIEAQINLNRYAPGAGYYVPGTAIGFG